MYSKAFAVRCKKNKKGCRRCDIYDLFCKKLIFPKHYNAVTPVSFKSTTPNLSAYQLMHLIVHICKRKDFPHKLSQKVTRKVTNFYCREVISISMIFSLHSPLLFILTISPIALSFTLNHSLNANYILLLSRRLKAA